MRLTLAPIVLAVAIGSAATAAHAQDDTARAAAAAIRGAMVEGCRQAPDDDVTAISLQIDALPASRLAPGATTASIERPVRVGSFSYTGRGLSLTSTEPRFEAFTVDPLAGALRSDREPGRLVTWNLPNGEATQMCRTALILGPPAYPRDAPRVLILPEMAGYELLVRKPLIRTRHLALMKPADGAERTLIVSFDGDTGDSRIEAELPVALQGLLVMVPIHGGPWGVFVIGRQEDGSIVQANLRMDPPT